MARRQILSLSERESLLALPDEELTLTRMAYFSEHDLALISAHRKPASRFGFAVLLCYLKNVGFTPDKKIPPSDGGCVPISSKSPKFAPSPVISRATDSVLYDSINT